MFLAQFFAFSDCSAPSLKFKDSVTLRETPALLQELQNIHIPKMWRAKKGARALPLRHYE